MRGAVVVSGGKGEPARSVLLGIDPGTAVTGFGAVAVDARRRATLLQCGVIRTSPRTPLPRRLLEIHEGVDELLDEFAPAVLVVEHAFQGKNARSALTLGQARGAIIVAGARRGVEIAEYAPRDIKKAVTGTGAATKEQVAWMVRRHLRLSADPAPSDAADGVAAALCHAFGGSLPTLSADRAAPAPRPPPAFPPATLTAARTAR